MGPCDGEISAPALGRSGDPIDRYGEIHKFGMMTAIHLVYTMNIVHG